ncbi:hypothetical protein MVQ26_01005 [Fusobacterium necrophorum]|uniref:Uncharacterized protein n=4 Tax=Fusobacterium necrophorum TaxID=859 RepID=A0AAN3VX79_9FUSO|nr:hypothetical protein [Fusobacterium necrophorum]AYV94688.1 hypothetical protein BWX37_03235 [Fusobacterium necrophorum subsp. funduliforme]EJU18775.1 hypothetical protein HMPREF1127_1087 [Fusobacterium necrophorum subsp. funduliforme Fnf 1007]KYM52176.1 hypothetical protein A2U04_10175 [Fusobacterium necrophorum subsp. funduliforme]KYM55322.1 hypothetical protein A2U06_08705 [Fusobacterium necrophorum subsp. funduliforme]KYM56525.1 hypothetical protein A2U17_01855 [Fusobacterium necrophorum
MQLSTLRYQGYTARITNLSTMEELQDWVSECNITLPQSNLISSMEARFQLEKKKINKGNEIKIEILDDVGNVLYTLQGEANIPRRTKSYTGLEVWEYTVKDSYNRLFEKVVPESQTFYDLYLCNTNDKHNSLLHKIASALGFREEELDFQSVAFENGSLIRLPFVYLEENSRWIDKLQAFIEASDGILYVKNKKLFYRPRNLTINHAFSFNRTNIITSLEEIEKEVLQNGIRLVYDRYEKLDNQVVFNLQKKIITEPNTNPDTEVPTMRISFITSAVSNPALTKATGYYFTTDDPSSKVDITLEENVHYKKVSWKETGAEVKFYNPLPYKLYVDNFEIKGVPLSMYSDNEVNVMFPNVLEKHQENFITSSKNKFIQTSEQAKFLAKKAMRRGVVNHAEYQFKTPFLHQIEVGGVYGLDLEDIHTVIEITNISINLRPGVFRMDIQGISVKEELGSVKITSKLSGNPKESYIDLRPVEEELKKQNGELKKLDRDVRSKLHKMNKVPTENVEENDIWLNPDTNEWKKFYNGVWNPISEKEILPSMKMYNSLDGNVIKLQGTADKVGAYLVNGGEKFGSSNGELAHVTFDKLGQFEAENPNNRVALNIKDPANPSQVNSQILLGVTDVKDEKWKDVIFALGDEASPNRFIFRNGSLQQTVNGEELSEKLSNVDRNISNLAHADSENKRDLEEKMNAAKQEINAQLVNSDKKWTALQGRYQETIEDVASFKTQTSEKIDTVQGALQKGNFVITANTTFDGAARFVSRGSNEVITIANGTIDFHRDGKRLTRIRNIRHGSVFTDSKGKGIVTFDGFIQPMFVMASIKSANFGKNMASVFCYASNIKESVYQFFLGGSNEDYVHGNPVTKIGNTYTIENCVLTTLTHVKINLNVYHTSEYLYARGDDHYMIERPSVRVIITRKDKTKVLLLEKVVEIRSIFHKELRQDRGHTQWWSESYIEFPLQIQRVYEERTDVTYEVKVTKVNSIGKYGYFDKYTATFEIPSSHDWVNSIEITAVSDTSKLGEVQGEGEVSYIAMEVD